MNTEGTSSASDSHLPVDPTPPAADLHPRSRGYYNQGQTEEVEAARSLQTQCESDEHQAALAKEEITADFLASYRQIVEEATKRLVQTAASRDEKKVDTSAAGKARNALLTCLKDIQSAAKQKSRLCRVQGLEFSLDGYLIGQNLALNRALLLTNSTGLQAKARKDSLPGYDENKLTLVAAAHAAFAQTKDEQSEGQADAGLATIDRNALVARLRDARMAILHAFDRIYAPSNPANAPTRRLLGLPPHRRLKD